MTDYLNDTDRLTIRNTLLADPDLRELEVIDAALATAISHILSPIVAKMLTRPRPAGDGLVWFYAGQHDSEVTVFVPSDYDAPDTIEVPLKPSAGSGIDIFQRVGLYHG